MPLPSRWRAAPSLLPPVLSLAVSLISSFSLVGVSAAQNAPANGVDIDRRLVVAVTEGRGPSERVLRFEVAPDADKFAYPQPEIDALAGALVARNRALSDSAQIDLAIKAFGLSQGGFAAIGTLAEHAAYLKGFSSINTALNNIGLVFALGTATRDASGGNTKVAVANSLKALANYAVSRFGSSALQIAGVASFIIDVTLSEWQSGLTEIAEDVQYCRYKAYYAANGMSVHDWQGKALELYKRAESGRDPKAFDTWLDGAVNEYVHRAFSSNSIDLYAECGGSSFGDTDYIQGLIEAEYKGEINEMLVEKVLPEITEYAWQRTLQGEVARANLYLRPDLNQTYRLEVTVYDADEDAQIYMELPSGGKWRGRLRADGTLQADITYYALMKAGFPEEITLVSEDGEETKELIIADGRMTAVFGMPATPLVARYSLREGGQECENKRVRDGGAAEFFTESRPAASLDHLDMAVTGAGTVYIGNFDGSIWSLASPGRYTDAATLFGAPYFDNIASLENCSFDMFNAGRVAEGDCTIERFEEKQVSARTVIGRTCISTASIGMVGVFAAMGGEMQYFDLDTPEGRAVIQTLRSVMGEHMPGFDPSSLHVGAPSNP